MAGARFYSCALQVNPFAYLARHAKKTSFGDESAYNAAMTASCLQNGVEVVGLTDHYRVKTTRSLADAMRAAGIVVLPGFEAVTKDGVHFLCLFDPETPEDEIDRRIGECGIAGDTTESPLGRHDAQEFLECCSRWGAACIAAHVPAAGGLLKVLSGQTAVAAWKSEHLVACSIAGPVKDLPQNFRGILENSNPDYRRRQPVAVINAQDVSDPADVANPNSRTYIKMSSVRLDGLKQAFLDPESRIRLTSDPLPPERTEFKSVEWTGGFLDGLSIKFNENLNVLIGGPGSGKSTVIESIRYALALPPVGPEAGKVHESMIKRVLRPGTKIALSVSSPHPSLREYVIERTVPNPPIVKSDSGDLLELSPADIAPRVEVYGQHEISEIARSPEERTRLLSRFIDTQQVGAARTEIVRELPKARQTLEGARARSIEIDEELAALPGLIETLKRYEEAGLEERLKEKSLLVREDQLLATASAAVDGVRVAVEAVQALLPINTDFVDEGLLADLPNREPLEEIHTILGKLSTDVTAGTGALNEAVSTAAEALEGVRKRRASGVSRIESEYEKTLRELQKENVDAQEFIRLRQRIERLQPLREEQRRVSGAIEEARKERDALIVRLEEAYAAEFRELESAAKRVTKRLAGKVQVTVQFQGNREPLLARIRSIPGRVSEACEALRVVDGLSLRALAAACRAGADELVKDYKIPAAQANRIAAAGEPLFMEIEELELPPTTQLELNVAAPGAGESWQPLEALSAGQKATAVLLLLLLESDAPLVIDQPEDDLDNRFITDGVVPKMRDEKRRRQFIFSTHNANIPVLGDAELIVGLQASGEAPHGQASIDDRHRGSIDMQSVCELVEELLEGGEDAFELRRLKYGIASRRSA